MTTLARTLGAAALGAVLVTGSAACQGTPLAVGAVAPDFTLTAATREGVGKPVRLSDYRGRTVVLAFFPKARTSGCTVQNDAYRDQATALFGADAVLFAISTDTPEVLASWAKERGYPHAFLADVQGEAGSKYGAYVEAVKINRRTLYVIGPDGKIRYVAAPFREVDPTAYTELAAAVARARGPAR